MGGKVNTVISKVITQITNLKSEYQNLQYRIQYDDLAYNISMNSEFICCNSLEKKLDWKLKKK